MQDAAHILLSYDGPPLSFLPVHGAKDVGVEIHSMSKGFNMIGWRMGWVCGHERIVQAFADIKDNSDSGQFIAIQKSAAAALDDPDDSRRWCARNIAAGCRNWWTRWAGAASIAACPAEPISSTHASPQGVAGRSRDSKRPKRPAST